MRLVVVSEAAADFTIATELADRVFVAEIGWLEEELLESQRQWVGEDSPGNRLTWTSVARGAKSLEIKAGGHFRGEPGLADARAARRAILYVMHRFGAVDAILLIRDMDDQKERREGLKQARTEHASGERIVIGLANSERECWVISGFVPATAAESRLLNDETRKLGGDPCLRSHELTACKDDHALRSPKRVLSVLTGSDSDRERKCWRDTPLNVLKERGAGNGLADYLGEVETILVPMITGRGGIAG